MAESNLSLQYEDVAKSVGRFLGFGRDMSGWSTDQLGDIHEAMDKGYRDFLMSHDWSFLKPIGTLSLVDGTRTYDLPDDFGSPRGPFTFSGSVAYPPVILTGEGNIREWYQTSDGESRPNYAAILPKAQAGTSGQRWEVVFYPTPEAAYTVEYAYNRLVAMQVRSGTPYPVGGESHAETIREACLCAAEKLFDDEQGNHTAEYRRLLALSIKQDGRMTPDYLGYCGDDSDDRGGAPKRLGIPDVYYKGSVL